MIAIANYGLGNLKAFANIFHRLGIPHQIASTPDELAQADRIILPGVGSFDYAMTKLNESGLRKTLEDQVLVKKKPVLGICVGMQMLAGSSDEGQCEGLNWIPGRVRKFDASKAGDANLPLPHMGWNTISIERANPLTKDLIMDRGFYFLHSYYFECADSANELATANYGIRYACVVQKENIFGIQCHPEKSHSNGVAFLKNFASF